MNTIKALREKTGLSQRKFAGKFNIPVANLQSWEQGVNRPLDYVVFMIQTILEQEKKIGELENERKKEK